MSEASARDHKSYAYLNLDLSIATVQRLLFNAAYEAL
jgi:hypothetical protein